METATLKELGMEDVSSRVTFPIKYVALEPHCGVRDIEVWLFEEEPVIDESVYDVQWSTSGGCAYVTFNHTYELPKMLQGVHPRDSLIKIVDEPHLDMDTLKKCILTLVNANSNWGMSLSHDDETFVSHVLKKLEGMYYE